MKPTATEIAATEFAPRRRTVGGAPRVLALLALSLLVLAPIAGLLLAIAQSAIAPAEPSGAVRESARYQWRVGDDPSFVDAGDGWTEGAPERRAFTNWRGVGWFRFFVEVAPEHVGQPVALRVLHGGPVEIYFDGRLVARRGRPAARAEDEIPVFSALDELLLVTPRAGSGDAATDGVTRHTVTIRYSSHFLDSPLWRGRTPSLSVEAGTPREMLDDRLRARDLRASHRALIGGASLAFALPFLAIFVLQRRVEFSTWFGLVSLMVACSVVSGFTDPGTAPWAVYLQQVLFLVSFLGLAVSIVGITHSESRPSPRVGATLAAVALLLLVLTVLQPYRLRQAVLVFMLVANVEVVRSIVKLRRAPSERAHREDAWLVAFGSVPIVVTGVHAVLVGLDVVPALFEFSVFPAPYYASLILMASMVIYLAFDFVRTQQRLEQQLQRVQELSDEALEQERLARRRAVDQARLEAEHARKTAELDEARSLQLSMLPRALPSLPGVELAVDTRTATEVGGDYYDAVLEPDGALLLAVGDAAGHGVQAGTVVAATKSLVQASVGDAAAPAARLERMASALRRSSLRRRHMALLLARVSVHAGGHRVELAGAAMPSVYLVRSSARAESEIEAIDLPGLPLGSFGVGPFATATRQLEPGDVLVFASDGVVESESPAGELLGFPRLERLVAAAARAGGAQRVLEHVLAAVDAFTGGAEPTDDRTLLVLRARGAGSVGSRPEGDSQ